MHITDQYSVVLSVFRYSVVVLSLASHSFIPNWFLFHFSYINGQTLAKFFSLDSKISGQQTF